MLKFRDENELERNLRIMNTYDLRVTIGFFGPEDARKTLCKVSY